MKKEICELMLEFYPKVVEFADLRSTYIANCVFNSFLSYTTIILNIVTIQAIRKTSSLPSSLKTLLLSLAVSDVAVGLLGQPFYTSFLVKLLQKHSPGIWEPGFRQMLGHLVDLSCLWRKCPVNYCYMITPKCPNLKSFVRLISLIVSSTTFCPIQPSCWTL